MHHGGVTLISGYFEMRRKFEKKKAVMRPKFRNPGLCSVRRLTGLESLVPKKEILEKFGKVSESFFI